MSVRNFTNCARTPTHVSTLAITLNCNGKVIFFRHCHDRLNLPRVEDTRMEREDVWIVPALLGVHKLGRWFRARFWTHKMKISNKIRSESEFTSIQKLGDSHIDRVLRYYTSP